MTKIKTAMLFAAGLGTRLKPFTDFHPKALALVNGQPLLGHDLKYLNKHGIEKVIINIHHFGNQIIDYIKNNNFGLEIIISDETNEVLETGGGLVKAKDLLGDSPFLVMNVDILTNLDLFKFIDFQISRRLNELVYNTYNKILEFNPSEKLLTEYEPLVQKIKLIISELDPIELQFNKRY
jgi:NDP-sugar pyrophosphorylase family protein